MKRILLTLGILSFLLINSPAYAITLFYNTTSVASGTQYDFTLNNDDISPDVFELFIHVEMQESDLLSFASPTGWGSVFGDPIPFYGADFPSGAYVEWFANGDAEGNSNNLPLGSSLSGFSFVSVNPITSPILFSINADEDFYATAQVTPAQGNNTVPEPLSLLLISLGFGGVGIFRKYSVV